MFKLFSLLKCCNYCCRIFFCILSKHFCFTDWSIWISNTASSCSSCCHSNHLLRGWWWTPSPTIAPKTKSREATTQLEICQGLRGKGLLLPHCHKVCMFNDEFQLQSFYASTEQVFACSWEQLIHWYTYSMEFVLSDPSHCMYTLHCPITGTTRAKGLLCFEPALFVVFIST